MKDITTSPYVARECGEETTPQGQSRHAPWECRIWLCFFACLVLGMGIEVGTNWAVDSRFQQGNVAQHMEGQ